MHWESREGSKRGQWGWIWSKYIIRMYELYCLVQWICANNKTISKCKIHLFTCMYQTKYKLSIMTPEKHEIFLCMTHVIDFGLFYLDFFFFPFCGPGVWIQGSDLLVQCSTTWVTQTALFCVGFFWDRSSQTIWLGWLQTTILLILFI
jgi:hypothetical protein